MHSAINLAFICYTGTFVTIYKRHKDNLLVACFFIKYFSSSVGIRVRMGHTFAFVNMAVGLNTKSFYDIAQESKTN